MFINRRLRKLYDFVRGEDTENVRTYAAPWQEAGHPYYLVTPVDNADGHGGYSRSWDFDENGIPCRRNKRQAIYYPLVVARYALKMLRVAVELRCPGARETAIAMADPILASARPTGAWGPASDPYSMASDTPHSNVQGIIISVLLRLFEGKPPEDVRRVLRRALERMLAPIGKGGTVSTLNGAPFLEEFPRASPSHILGGCIAGLFGLYDLEDTLGWEEAGRAAREVESSICANIGSFVTPGGWSYYALNVYGHRYLSSVHYHEYSTIKVSILCDRTHHPSLARTARTWRKAVRSSSRRVAFAVAKAGQVTWLRFVRRLPLQEG